MTNIVHKISLKYIPHFTSIDKKNYTIRSYIAVLGSNATQMTKQQ